MSDAEKKILETLSRVIPKLSKEDKSYLLGLGEGMAMTINTREKKEAANGNAV